VKAALAGLIRQSLINRGAFDRLHLPLSGEAAPLKVHQVVHQTIGSFPI
jgi:hypothetical protein